MKTFVDIFRKSIGVVREDWKMYLMTFATLATFGGQRALLEDDRGSERRFPET